MTERRLDVLAIGNAIVDVIANADDAFLGEWGMPKGAMRLIDEAEATRLYDAMGPAREASGGSAANTVAGLASLGLRTGFIGQLAEIKGVDLLIEAFQLVSSEIAAELRIYGDLRKTPAFGERLLQLAARNPKISFMGSFERPQIAEVFSEIDVIAVKCSLSMSTRSCGGMRSAIGVNPRTSQNIVVTVCLLPPSASAVSSFMICSTILGDKNRPKLARFFSDSSMLSYNRTLSIAIADCAASDRNNSRSSCVNATSWLRVST